MRNITFELFGRKIKLVKLKFQGIDRLRLHFHILLSKIFDIGMLQCLIGSYPRLRIN